MSLIQDALKRQQEETESTRVPLKVKAPRVPEAMPVPSSQERMDQPLPSDLKEKGQSARPWKRIAGIIIFCVLILWSAGLVVILVMKQSAASKWLDVFMPDARKVHATLEKAPLPGAPAVVQPADRAMTPSAPPPAPVRASAAESLFSPAALAAPAFADADEDAAENAFLSGPETQSAPPAIPGPASLPQGQIPATLQNAGIDRNSSRSIKVVWPRLKLSAVFLNVGAGQSGARLNNKLILLGDQIDGVTLVEIRPDSVVLKYGQQTRALKMGATLN